MKRRKCAAKIMQHVTDTQVNNELKSWNTTYDCCEQIIYRGKTLFTKTAAFSQGLSLFVWVCGLVDPVNLKDVVVTRSNGPIDDDDE